MILADVRHRLGRGDAQLALRLIARGSDAELEATEARLRDEGIDALLDDPRLLRALLDSRQAAHASLLMFAYVIVRHALRGVGEEDRMLADYAASVLVHFAATPRTTQITEYDDEQYATLVDLCRDLETADARRSFLVRLHLGNYALWLSGMFPDRIEWRRWRRGGPDLDYYEEMGRRGYTLAAAHRLAEQYGMTPLLAAVAERFATLRLALNAVSDAFFFPHHHTPERLMRQARDEVFWSWRH